MAYQRARLPERRADRLRHERVLVAAAQAVTRAGASRGAALRGRYARRDRSDRRASPRACRCRRAQAAILRSATEARMTPVTTSRYDAVIIGGGHNGLVTAAYLARAGKKVVVLERRPMVGGAAVTEEVVPGFKFSVFSYVVSLLRPEIIRDLDLPAHGLQILPLESTVTPLDNGDYLAGWADADETRREIARHSPRDAEAASRFGHLMHHMAMAVKPILGMVPPDPASLSFGDLRGLMKLGGHFRSLGAERFHALYKLTTMSSADYLGEIDGAFRAWGFQKGGTGGISESIASAARAFGAEVRTNANVERVIVEDGRTTGVALANGDELL